MSNLKLKDELDINEKVIIADLNYISQFSKAKKKEKKINNFQADGFEDIVKASKREQEIKEIAEKIEQNQNYQSKIKYLYMLRERMKNLYIVNEISFAFTGIQNKLNVLKDNLERTEADGIMSHYLELKLKVKDKKPQKYVNANDYDTDDSIDVFKLPIVKLNLIIRIKLIK
jgi:hypothetical protein